MNTPIQRNTHQLQAVISALETLPCPVSVRDIIAHTKFVPSTVYRCLRRLESTGIVSSLVHSGEVAYELADRHHHHIHCRVCDKVAEIPVCPKNVSVSVSELGQLGFASVTGHVLEFFGICNSCVIKNQ